MRLLVVTGDYPYDNHPNNVFVEQLVNEMVRQGVHVDVIAPQSITNHLFRKTPLLPKEQEIQVEEFKYKVYRPSFISLGKCASWIEKVVSYIKARVIEKCIKDNSLSFDVLYCHFWHYAYLVRRYAYVHNVPIVVACGEGDNALEELASKIKGEEKSRFVATVKGVVSVSSENKRKCLQFQLANEQDIVVLPNAVDSALFSVEVDRDAERTKMGVQRDDMLVAFLGNFIYRKGPARLSSAIDLLSDPSVKSMFIGSSRPGEGEEPSCKNIVFKNRLNHSEIPRYLKLADVFCLPTLKEGCSNAIVEALSCGLPVVSSNLPFNEDILDDSNSILVDPLNIDEIASALKHLKENKEYRESLSMGALKKARELTIDRRAKKIIEFIQSKI